VGVEARADRARAGSGQLTVVYLNHTGRVGGGERSLLTLLAALPPTIRRVVACPDGDLVTRATRIGVAVERVPGTDSSLRLHPWHTTRGAADIARAAFSVRRLCGRVRADLIHANSIRAGLAASLAALSGGPPAVVHVRDCLPAGAMTRLTRELIARGAAAVVTNSNYTGRAFGLPGSHRLYNPLDLSRYDPARVDRGAAREALGLAADDLVLAVVAQITPWKGQIDAIRAVARLRPRWPTVRLLLVGSTTFVDRATRYDNRAYLRELHTTVADEGLERHVRFLGERDDIPQLLAACNLALAPSWEEPFGRSIAEAMAMGVPVVATNVGGPAEMVRDRVDGVLLAPCDPERWAQAVDALLASPDTRASMSRHARAHAQEAFDATTHVDGLLSVYDTVLNRKRRRTRRNASATSIRSSAQ
jgi:L-malate glycosyltransferase